MKFFKALLPTMMMVGMFSLTLLSAENNRNILTRSYDSALESRHETELTEKDWEELYNLINSKRTITLAEKSNNLTIAGDVRVFWRHPREVFHRRHSSSSSSEESGSTEIETSFSDEISAFSDSSGSSSHSRENHFSHDNYFDVALNLYLDYVCDRTWAVAQLEYFNSMGIDHNRNSWRERESMDGSGDDDNLNLKKAYLGYNICCGGDSRFDIELGRRNLYHVFDSEVEFLSRFDGLLLRYTGAWDCLFDYHLYVGGFVIDERINQFGWIAEVGAANINDTHFDALYSFIDWKKNGTNRYHVHDPKGTDFLVSQWLVKYHVDPNLTWCRPSHFYGAYLRNHDARRLEHHKHRRNSAWYVGYRMGEVFEQGDWAFDVQYQYVEALAIPDQDVSGIGRGNYYGETVISEERLGNGNYKGWRVEYLYAITDNLSIDAFIEASRAADQEIGGRHRFSEVQVEMIYAF